jgi:asparagine synthase (glutamine-hydrolysing)
MCGIFGAVGHTIPEPVQRRILDLLEHRGPDGNGTFVDAAARVTLLHTRLAIIDLITGAQPLHSQDGDIVLVCNGEIYDFEALRTSLEAKGHRFATRSDSEVIIGLYQEHGLGCFEHLRGEFAFLLYDRARQFLIAGRDRFGIKPLYFSRLEHGFVFASEMKAMFASRLVEPKINAAALDPLLDLDPGHAQFPFEDIEQVPPASYLTVDLRTGDSEVVGYWSPQIPDASAEPVATDRSPADRWAATVRHELEEAVRLRLRADVPVGLYLSGGIDSAFVGALMAANLESPLHSFSISFTGSGRNEQEFTRQAAAFLGSRHHELIVTKAMLWDNLEDTVWSTELPFATLAPVGKFLLSREARKKVKVVLNGQGADEVFLGYRSFFQKAIEETRSGQSPGVPANVRLRRLKLAGLPPALLGKLSLLLFHRSCRAQVAQARYEAFAPPAMSRPIVNRVQEGRIAEMPVDILGYLGDRVEMAHSIEVRVPFLDHKLYDAAKPIPADFKLRDGVEKAVLRDAARDLLPESIRTRRKLGFMLTGDRIDFFGADREMAARFGHLMSREAFERTRLFSWRAFQLIGLLARLPLSNRVRALGRFRRNANKVLMYMLQAQMLHDMYIANPRWAKARAARSRAKAPSANWPEGSGAQSQR